MIEINSYILKSNVGPFSDVQLLDQNPDRYFVNVNELSKSDFEPSKNWNFEYLEGAIVLSHYGNNIMSYRHWDTVSDLWTYLMITLDTAIDEGEHKMQYPGQPISIGMRFPKGDYLELLFDDKYWRFKKNEFLPALLHAAKEFFATVASLSGEESNEYGQQIVSKYWNDWVW